MTHLVWLFFALSFLLGVFIGCHIGKFVGKRKLRRVASAGYHAGANCYANGDGKPKDADHCGLLFPSPLSERYFGDWWRVYKNTKME